MGDHYRLVPCMDGCGEKVRSYKARRARCAACQPTARLLISKRYRRRQKERGAPRPFLRDQHGMTELEYAQMVVAQGGRCAGCSRMPPIAGKQLHIDHDHGCCPKGGRSCERCRRGLLCAECNMALGLLRDNLETLESLAAYLRKWGR